MLSLKGLEAGLCHVPTRASGGLEVYSLAKDPIVNSVLNVYTSLSKFSRTFPFSQHSHLIRCENLIRAENHNLI